MKNLYKNEQSGRSMVEMLGVLAIIGVLSIGGISGYSKAMAKFRVNKTLDQISMLVMNIRSLYSGNIDYTGLADKVVISMGIIPKDMLDKASPAEKIINAFQGGVSVAAANTGGAGRSFTVTYNGLTKEACVAIATADWGSQAGSGLVKISVGPSTNKTTAGALTAYTIDNLPVTLSAAAVSCSETKDIGNTVQWEYY